MRIIGGRLRGHRLRSPRGLRVRPTADPVRERLFAILADRLVGARFLDLCAGTGAVGLEALSRGARRVTFVEIHRGTARLLRGNLELAGTIGETELLVMDGQRALARLASRSDSFDLVYVDPPYADDPEDELLQLVSRRSLLAEGGLAIRERSRREPAPERVGELRLTRSVECGDTRLTFYQEVIS